MAVDASTLVLLNSVLGSSTARKLFSTIAARRIAELTSLKPDDADAARELGALQDADLIASAQSGKKFYVTAKGLKVARELEQFHPS